jgi:excisionase family DNA binding protein
MDKQRVLPARPDLLTLKEVAATLQVSVWTAYEWAAAGYPDFPRAIRLRNRQIRVRREDLAAWLEECAA